MATVVDPETAELERVLLRLSAIDNDSRLEQVLCALLPKLLVRFEEKKLARKTAASTATQPAELVLVQIFNHLSRWVKPPSAVKLPIVDLACGIRDVLSREGEAMRLSMMFIELSFARCAWEEEQKACIWALLSAREAKFDSSLAQLHRLVFSVLGQLTPPQQQQQQQQDAWMWIADQCVEACFANQALAVPALEFLLRWSHQDAASSTSSRLPMIGRLLLAGLVSSSLSQSTTTTATTRLGREAVKRVRDWTDSAMATPQDKLGVMDALFRLVLEEKRAGWAARAAAVDLLTRYFKQQQVLSDKLCKVLITGLCGAAAKNNNGGGVPPVMRIATLQLLQETCGVIPKTGPLDVLLSNALQRCDEYSTEERGAYLSALASWLHTRSSHSGSSVKWKAKHCLLLLQEQFRDEPALEPALHAVLAKLATPANEQEIALLVRSNTVLELAEEGVVRQLIASSSASTPPPSQRLQSFLLELARLARGSSADGDVVVAGCWISLCLHQHLSFSPSSPPPPQFAAMFRFAQLRDLFPRHVLRFLVTLLRENDDNGSSQVVDEFVQDHVRPLLPGGGGAAGDVASQLLACECVTALLRVKHALTRQELISWDWLRTNLQSSNAELRNKASGVVKHVFDLWSVEITRWIEGSLGEEARVGGFEVPGALLAAGQLPEYCAPAAAAVEQWLVRTTECGEFTDLAFQSLTHNLLLLRPLQQQQEEAEEPPLHVKARQALKQILGRGAGGSQARGVIHYIGQVWGNYQLLLDEVLLSSSVGGGGATGTMDAKMLPVQMATGMALRGNAGALDALLNVILQSELSKRQRSGCAVVLEQMVSGGVGGGSDSSLRIQQAFLSLLGAGAAAATVTASSSSSGESDVVKLCCCRGLALNYFQQAEDNGSSSTAEQLTVNLVRRFTMQQPTPDRQLQELCVASVQAGNSSLVFHLLAIVGGAGGRKDFAGALARTPPTRLAVQFIRRRHLDGSPLVQQVAHTIFPTSASVKQALNSSSDGGDTLQAVYQEACRMLRDSFVMSERKSGLLTMVECLHHHGRFITSPIETWRDVFRALDDLDDAIGSHTALGHCAKRYTLHLNNKEEEQDYEVFAFLLDQGLGSSVLKVRHLTRSFFMDAVASKRLPPGTFAVRLVDALLRTIGESESAMLQYAQFHTRGGQGTGELGVEAHKLEEVRCRLAVESAEYAAILKCVQRIDKEGDAVDQLFACVARVLRTGVGLATLASAVSLVQYLASEESGLVAGKDTGGVVLGALTGLLLRDQSVELKRRTVFAAGKLALLLCSSASTATSTAAQGYFEAISDLYDRDPEQTVDNRLLAAQACRQVVDRKRETCLSLARPAFLGRFDEDKLVAEEWRACWAEIGVLASDVDLVRVARHAINGYSYRQRRQGAQAVVEGDGVLLLSSKNDEEEVRALVDDLLRLISATGTAWEGKDVVIACTGRLLSQIKCDNVAALLERALGVLSGCVLTPAATTTTTTTTAAATLAMSKWTAQAVFEALAGVLSNPAVLPTTKLVEYVQQCAANLNAWWGGEAVVMTAMLGSLQAACGAAAASSGGDDDQVQRAVMALILQGGVFTKQASWNVKVACLQCFEACTDDVFTQHGGGLWALIAEMLEEEKKPSVLLALLRVVRGKLPRGGTDGQMLAVRQAVHRLERHADAAVAKAANETLK